MRHISISKLIIISSDNGLLPGRHEAIIWTNAVMLLIQTSKANFSEILSEIHTFSFKKMHLKMSSGKWRPFCLCLNVLIPCVCILCLLLTLTVWLSPILHLADLYSRDHSVCAPSQWETALQCNAVFHWLGAYTEWSLYSTRNHLSDLMCSTELLCINKTQESSSWWFKSWLLKSWNMFFPPFMNCIMS